MIEIILLVYCSVYKMMLQRKIDSPMKSEEKQLLQYTIGIYEASSG